LNPQAFFLGTSFILNSGLLRTNMLFRVRQCPFPQPAMCTFRAASISQLKRINGDGPIVSDSASKCANLNLAGMANMAQLRLTLDGAPFRSSGQIEPSYADTFTVILRAQLESYSDALYRAPLSIDWRQLNLAGRGNSGGSADIADHLLLQRLQLGQRRVHPSQAPILVHSLTTCANASPRREGEQDILAALRPANSMDLKTITLAGFGGSEAVRLADISLQPRCRPDPATS
jgi:hypothetical protein